jgi:hypothetical protein
VVTFSLGNGKSMRLPNNSLVQCPCGNDLRFDRSEQIRNCECGRTVVISEQVMRYLLLKFGNKTKEELRDFLPLIKGFNPTAHIALRDREWCHLNPDSPNDRQKFVEYIQTDLKRTSEHANFVESPTVFHIVRVILKSKVGCYPAFRDSRGVLSEVLKSWPQRTKTKYLLFCGGFVRFSWPKGFPDIDGPINPPGCPDSSLTRIYTDESARPS